MSGISAAVVIPTLDRPEMVRRVLSSVLRGDRRPEQIVVCDQSAGEETRLLVEALPAAGVDVRYVRLEKPAASAARNAGLFAAGCDLVAFIDDDCVAGPLWLAALVGSYESAASKETVAAVTGRVLPLATGKGGVAVSSRAGTERRYFRSGERALERGRWAPWDTGTGANILAPRSILLETGGFDSRLGPGTPARAAEDIDLLYRIARAGTIVFEPEAVVYHPTSTRRRRLASRYVYGKGMGSMLALHLAERDPTARALLGLYLRHQAAQAFRRGRWGPIESLLTLAGAAGPLAAEHLKHTLRGSRAKGGRRRAGQEGTLDG